MPDSFEKETETLVAYLDGTATEEQAARLEGRLVPDPELSDRLALQARIAVLLETLGRQESHRREFIERLPWKAWGAVAAAVVATAVLSAVLLRPRGGPDPLRVARAGPDVRVERDSGARPAVPGLLLGGGDRIRTGPGGAALLKYDGEETSIELSEETEVGLPAGGRGKRLEMSRGGIVVSIAPQAGGRAFSLATPQARIEVLGTVLAVRVERTATFMEVREGRARISGAGGEGPLVVPAGRRAIAGMGRPPEILPATVGDPRGLKGEYFDNEDFTNPVLTRIDPKVDFTWGLGAPDPSMDPDYFSIRWTGFVEADVSGTYTFYVVSDDGARLWVDGKLLIDDWKVRGTQERSGEIVLEAGKKTPLRLEYFDCVSMSQVHLSWSGPGRRKELVPPDRLSPPR